MNEENRQRFALEVLTAIEGAARQSPDGGVIVKLPMPLGDAVVSVKASEANDAEPSL